MEVGDRLVIFDVEGVLIPKVRFILFDVAGRMGFQTFVKAAFFGLLYETGLISLKTALKRLYKLLEGMPFEELISIFREVPLMPNVREVLRELKESGFKIAMISSGLPRIALDELAGRLGVDYASGLEIGISGGHLTGEIWGDVIEHEGKAVILKNILERRRPSFSYCVVVADDRNNLPIFPLCNLRIGYNPDFILSYKSDHVVKGDLSGIIPIIISKGRVEEGSRRLSKSDLLREAIHIGGFSVPFICTYLLDRYILALLIFLVTLLYALSELQRMRGGLLPIFSYITQKASGEPEFHEFIASPIFYAFGIILTLLIFQPPVSYVSITVLTLGDGCAALFGKQFGRKRFPLNKGKRLEGSICGFISAFLGSLLFINPIGALVASAVGMTVETLPMPVNDNIVIPIASGLALTLLLII